MGVHKKTLLNYGIMDAKDIGRLKPDVIYTVQQISSP